jgi:prophage tail gpP-like protein
VDCSAIHSTGHWANTTATKIIGDLLAPYGLSVSADPPIPDTTVYKRFAIEQGEAALRSGWGCVSYVACVRRPPFVSSRRAT